MTHPTKAIYNYVLLDYVKISNVGNGDILYDATDLSYSMDQIIPIRFHEQIEYDGVKFEAYNAGHVLGAAMFLVEIDGVRILYTGDYSREEDRHLKAAEIPKKDIDILIVEATYGKNVHEPRQIREDKFKYRVHDIMKKGGKCLLPVFALGRAQELLLILNEYWKEHEDLKSIPIYYAGSLAQKSLSVFRTYRNMMGDAVRKKVKIAN
jgi:cleavage and polyadenylation specificity factor subunit 3